MDDRIEHTIAQATEGLKNDPELRLDVSAELRTHLDDTAQALAADGVGEAAAVEQALHAFGSPVEIAGDLLEANKRRMTLRARMRLAIQTLLIPAAVLVALYFGYGGFARVVNFTRSFSFNSTKLPELPKYKSAEQRKAEERIEHDLTKLRSHSVTPEEMRKLWQPYKHTQDSRAVYGYYTSLLNVPRIPRQGEAPSANFDDFERCMRAGKQIDPGNALYSYQLAAAYLSSGMISREARVSTDEKGDEILDRQRFEQGVKELRLALAQPTVLEYNSTMMRNRLELLPPPRLTEDYLQRLTISSYELFPIYAQRRSLARTTLGCARLLIAEGRMDEAKPLLEAWHSMPTQMLRETDTMLEILVATALTAMLGEGTADIYDSIGQRDKAAQVRADTERLIAPVQVRKEQRHQGMNARIEAEFQKHGSMYTVINSPVFLGMRPYTIDELAPMRYHEQTMVEELSLSVVLLLSALVMVGAWFSQVRWFLKLRAANSAPLLLLPSWQETVRIIGVGILLPLAVYYLYTRSPLGGREYGMYYMRWRILTEMGLVTLLLAWLPGMLARRYVRRRCEQLNVPVDAEKQTMWRVLRFFLGAFFFVAMNIGILLLCATFANALVDFLHEWSDYLFVASVSTLIIGDVLFLRWVISLALQRRRETGPRKLPDNALYRGTVARSLVPVYAFAIVLLAVTVQPYLLHQEAKWLRADRIFFPREDSGVFMPIETRVVRKLQAEMLQAAEEIEKAHQ